MDSQTEQGEAVFAPASLSAGEDEGYVMAYAHAGRDLVRDEIRRD